MVDSTREETSSRLRRVVARGVGRVYGSTVALRGVDVTFEAGEIVVIEGHNGSGKTTLLGILGTRIVPSFGQVIYEPGGGSIAAVRQQIGWVGHETFAYPDLTTRQNVELTARLYGRNGRTTWERLATRFGLNAFADRPMRCQSRGQRQRVALARAMAHGPSLLLLDEPTSGLDSQGVEVLVRLIREEAAAGRLVVMVTHEHDLAGSLATRRLWMDAGTLVEGVGRTRKTR